MTKEEFKTKYKIIYDSYKSKLLDLHNESVENINNPMLYFVNYLKFMRDFYLITTPETDTSEETDIKISSLMLAIDVYNKYMDCKTLLADQTINEAEHKKLEEDKQQLLGHFWALIAANMEDWLPDVA